MWFLVIIVYFLFNIFFVIIFFILLNSDWNVDGYLYYVFFFVGIVILLLGVVYWVVWIKFLLKFGGYSIVVEMVIDEMGEEVMRYYKVLIIGFREVMV